MNADLEASLKELGPEYRSVVDRLRAGAEVSVRGANTRGMNLAPLMAASLLVSVSLTIWFSVRAPKDRCAPHCVSIAQPSLARSNIPREYRMTTEEMIASQRADGSWANDFLTRRNADALKDIGDPRAQIAYKKAMRNLRFRSLHAL